MLGAINNIIVLNAQKTVHADFICTTHDGQTAYA